MPSKLPRTCETRTYNFQNQYLGLRVHKDTDPAVVSYHFANTRRRAPSALIASAMPGRRGDRDRSTARRARPSAASSLTGSSNRIFTIIGASDQTRHARYGSIVSASSAAASGVAPVMNKRRRPRSRRTPEKGPLLSINAATRCFHAAYAPLGRGRRWRLLGLRLSCHWPIIRRLAPARNQTRD